MRSVVRRKIGGSSGLRIFVSHDADHFGAVWLMQQLGYPFIDLLGGP